jgi:hypothetical protein
MHLELPTNRLTGMLTNEDERRRNKYRSYRDQIANEGRIEDSRSKPVTSTRVMCSQ